MTAFLLPLLVPLASALAAPPAPDLVEVHLPAQAQGVRLVVAPPPGADAEPYVIELRIPSWSAPEAPALSVEPLAAPPVFLAPESVSLASAAPATAALATQPLDELALPASSADAFLVTHAPPPPEGPVVEPPGPPAPPADAVLEAHAAPPVPPPVPEVKPELRAAGAAFEMACESGHAQACVTLAGMVADGSLGTPDPARAKELYDRACQNGDADSCAALSPLPDEAPVGSATPPAAPVAPALSVGDRLAEACDQGDNAACTELGGRSTHGDGVPQDPVLAARLFQRACANGVMDACTDLGILYMVGEGVSQDETRAERLFQLACNGGGGDERACGLLEE
ncbi:MAG: tetratricopeptide repeat protein [Pseudomonadota bacterium]